MKFTTEKIETIRAFGETTESLVLKAVDLLINENCKLVQIKLSLVDDLFVEISKEDVKDINKLKREIEEFRTKNINSFGVNKVLIKQKPLFAIDYDILEDMGGFETSPLFSFEEIIYLTKVLNRTISKNYIVENGELIFII